MKKDDFMKIVRSKAKETLTESEENFFGSIGEAIEKALTEESVERNKQLNAITSKLGSVDEGEDLATVVRNLATVIDNVEKKATRSFSNADKYNLRKKLEEKREDIQRARQGGNPWSIEFKASRAASALMTTGTILTGAQAVNNPNLFDDMDVVVIQYPKNFILDAISSRLVSKVPQTWRWKEQITAGDGVPAATNEGAAKPLVDKKFTWAYANRVKYAGRVEMTEEVEIDFEQLVIDIVNMFEQDVLRAWNNGVLAAVVAYASAYTSTSLDGTVLSPDIFAVIAAGIAWIQNNDYEPDVIAMNPADVWVARTTQDSNGNYKISPLGVGDNFAGLTPFITNKVAAGKILIGTRSTIQEQHGNFIIRKGTHGDQFIENESTVVGEIFSVLKTPTQSKPSWVYMDIATIKAALQKV